MATAIQNKYHWNEERYQWERIDRVQYYRGCEVDTISYHAECGLTPPDNHRAYIVKYPSGEEVFWGINKRGGNIKKIREWIDFKIKRNDPDMMSFV